MSSRRLPASRARVLVVGMGSEFRRDDGVGVAVARRVRELGRSTDGLEVLEAVADPLELMGRWDGAELAVLIDATRSSSAPGTLQIVDLERSSSTGSPTSTHGIGVVGALRLAVAMGGGPRRTVLLGVEGADFSNGCGLSCPVEGAVEAAVTAVMSIAEGALGAVGVDGNSEEVSPCA